MKAAGEPSRLRLLALCSERDLSVTQLARALRQSGPRVSRHLKILCEAGLLERVRQGQWVHYRLTDEGGAAKFVRGVLAELDRDDEVLARDRLQAYGARSTLPAPPVSSRLGRNLAAFIEGSRPQTRLRSALLIGTHRPEVLEVAAALASQFTAVVSSRREAQATRAFIEARGLPGSVLVAASPADIAAGSTHEAVIFDFAGGPAGAFESWLTRARSALTPGGPLWLFVRYDALETGAAQTAAGTPENPLTRLRRLLAESGLACRQLSPIEADGEHVLAVSAAAAAASEATTELKGLAS